MALHGEVKVEGYYSDVRALYQDIPNAYLRTSVNADLELLGLPFRLGVMYSTENNSTHRINGFRIGFSNETFLANLRKNMLDVANEKRFGAELDSLQLEQFRLQTEIGEINNEFATPAYQEKLSISAETIGRYDINDTINAESPSYRYAESKDFISQHQLKVKQLATGKARLKNIEARQQDIRIIKQNNLGRFEEENKMKQTAGVKLPVLHRMAMHIKTLEAGKISPAYNSLLLDGTCLNGINIEVNPGMLYGAFAYGSLEFVLNASRPGEYLSPRQAVLNKNADVLWLRAGIRNGSRFSFILNQMTATVHTKQSESNGYYRNMLIGAEMAYQLKGHFVKIEMAQSTYGSSEGYLNNLKKIQSGSDFNYALKGAYQVMLKKSHQLTLSTKASYVAPDYFSVCVPFIRRDNLKLELGSGISLFKNVIRLDAGIRNEQDNFYRKSPVSNNIRIYNLAIGFRYKRYPYIQIRLSPGINQLRYLAGNLNYKQEFSAYTISSGYTYSRKQASYSITAFSGYSSYMQLFASDSFSYSHNYQLGTNLSVFLRKAGIELSSGGSVATLNEGKKQLISDSKLTKMIGKCAVGGGYLYTQDPWDNTSALYYGSFSANMPFNILLYIKAGHNAITRNDPDYGGPGEGLIVNMNICKKF